MEAVETQLSRITAQSEETGNRIAQLEAKIAALAPPPAPAPAAAAAVPAPSINTDGPAALVPASTTTAPAPAAAKPAPAPTATAATTTAAAKPAQPLAPPAKTAPAAPAKPASASRVAAVKAIEKPKTDDAGDDEYSYGYRLWEAKFYPEAAQQLNLFLDKYPKHARVSFARNLLGRVLLDDGKPYEAGQWFLKNYQADKKGARAPDSLLYLGEAMRQLKHNDRACVALKEFSEVYKTEATGRLKSQYEATRTGAKCN
jgi:TolA-binding protein